MVMLITQQQLKAPQSCIFVILDLFCVEMRIEFVYQLEYGQDQYQIVSVSDMTISTANREMVESLAILPMAPSCLAPQGAP